MERKFQCTKKLGNEYGRLFSRLNFPGAAILIFYDAIRLPGAIVNNQRPSVYNNGAIILGRKNSKWRLAGNFKAKMDDIRIHVFVH